MTMRKNKAKRQTSNAGTKHQGGRLSAIGIENYWGKPELSV
jgi:hypothetical protein